MNIQVYEPYFITEDENGKPCHKYQTPDGTPLIGVTDICKSGLGIYQYKRISPKAQIGTHIHKALQLYDENDLNEETLDPIIKPYIEQYKVACKENGIVRLQNEVRRYHPTMLFGGTLDLICKVNGKYAIIDFKTGKQENWHKWQTAAYAELMKEEIGTDVQRYCLYLNGPEYALVQHTEENNFREFLALSVVVELKRRNGYT